MFCIDCGTKNPDGARFCMECGMRMPVREARPATSDPPSHSEAETTEAASAVAGAAAESAASAKDLILSAFRLSESGRHEEARALCAHAIALEPRNADAHALLSTLYEHEGDMTRAIEERERVLEIMPDSLADREKLRKLKQGEAQSQPRRILSSRPAAPSLLENPAVALAAAVVVFLVIALGGGGVVWYMNRPASAHADGPPSSGQQPLSASGPLLQGGTGIASAIPQQPSSSPGQGVAPPPSAGPAMPAASAPVEEEPNHSQQPAPRRRARQSSDFTGMVPPASVSITTPPLEQYRRQQAGQEDGTSQNTIILPDRDPWNGQPPLPAAQPGENQPNTASAPAPRDPGRITIVVSQAGKPAASAGEAARQEETGRETASMDSRARRAIAQDLQAQGQYKRAAAEYKRALEGAGDEAGMIHMKIGLCYQRAEERDSAISHFNEAIRLLQRQIQSGRGVEAARQAIRVCEAGIRNLK